MSFELPHKRRTRNNHGVQFPVNLIINDEIKKKSTKKIQHKTNINQNNEDGI
jgi:hypothetical protein